MKVRRRIVRKRRAPIRRRRFGGRRVARRRVNKTAGQYANTVETLPGIAQLPGGSYVTNFTSISISTPGPCFSTRPILLADFARSAGIGSAYQYYKVKYVEYKFTPQADTFAAGSAYGVPTLYYMVNKGKSVPTNITSLGLKSLGAKPIRLDDKTITIRYKPGVILDTAITTSGGATQQYNKPLISPWLTTNGGYNSGIFSPSQVDHNGLLFFVENAGTAVNYNCQMTVHFSFMRPNLPVTDGVAQSIADTSVLTDPQGV